MAMTPTARGISTVRGFSLIELMVTVAVLAVVMAIAIPNMASVVNNNRLTAEANEVVVALQHARSEAVKLNSSVSLCHSANGATCTAAAGPWVGWITIVVSSGEVLRNHVLEGPVAMTSQVDTFTFRGDGLARGAAGGLLATTATVCLPTTRPPQNQRVVQVRSGSRISTESRDGGGACP